ncbi:MAG: DUF1330 domain-containing protein [Pseudomonadota bacterium]
MSVLFIGEVDIHDERDYAVYARHAAELIARHGGEVLAKGGETTALEGAPPGQRIVVVRFKSREDAMNFLDSPQYKSIKSIRMRSSTARTYLVSTDF